jgi:hypothetical protein
MPGRHRGPRAASSQATIMTEPSAAAAPAPTIPSQQFGTFLGVYTPSVLTIADGFPATILVRNNEPFAGTLI